MSYPPIQFAFPYYFCFIDLLNISLDFGYLFRTLDIPLVTARKSVVNTKENDDAELYCDFETFTESRVIWRKDGKQLQISTGQEPRSKYSAIYGQPKGSKNHAVLVVNKVQSTDLGQYECKVENKIGSELVKIELTFVPEPPHLQKIETDGKFTITHWHIRSMQPLTEVMLKYRQKDVRTLCEKHNVGHILLFFCFLIVRKTNCFFFLFFFAVKNME